MKPMRESVHDNWIYAQAVGHEQALLAVGRTDVPEPTFELWLEFEVWEPKEGDDPEDDFFNMQVTLADGRKYALNVWTFEYLSRAVRECRQSGENLHGGYLEPPDLFVQRMDRALIEKVVTDLIARGGIKEEWRVPEHGGEVSP